MKLLEKLVSVIAPHECLSCGAEGAFICKWCLPDACPDLPERCFGCSKLSRDSRVCAACRRRSSLVYVWVRSEYEGIAKALIHKLKFERAGAASSEIATMIAQSLPYLSEGMLITHIPTATSRQRQRGYDQAQLIAKEVARITDRTYIPLLARQGQSRQVGANRQKRMSQLEGAFRIRNGYAARRAEILLIDDIVTTGATLEAAAQILKTAGAKRISAAIFARKQ